MPKFDNGGAVTRSNKKNQKGGIPHIYEPKCQVCKSSHRRLIDQMLVSGMPYLEIERQFASLNGPKRRSIANHSREHLGYEEAGVRAVLEREAVAAQKNFERGVERIITGNSYNEIALQKAYESLISGEVTVEPRDAVKIIELQTKMKEAHNAALIDDLRVQNQCFMQAVKEEVPREFWNGIVNRMAELLRAAGQDIDWNVAEDEVKELTPADVIEIK